MDLIAIKPWFLALRPKTLTAAVVPIIVASALIISESFHFKAYLSICALLSAIFIQIGTNLVNDAIDFKKGADDENRIGPKRVTQSGLLSSKQVMLGAYISFGIASILGLPLVIQGGWFILLIGLFSLFFAYAYTGGPFPLAYVGLGDLFVLIFFGIIAVGGTFYLHAQTWTLGAWIAGIQVGLLSCVLIAINNFRDAHLDVKVDKKTLAVRFGPRFARFEIALLSLVPYVLGFYWIIEARTAACLLPLFCFPLTRNLINSIYNNEPGPIYNQYLAKSALIHLLFGVLLSIGLLIP